MMQQNPVRTMRGWLDASDIQIPDGKVGNDLTIGPDGFQINIADAEDDHPPIIRKGVVTYEPPDSDDDDE